MTHAAAVLRPADLVPRQRVDAVVPGDALHLGLAEELERLAPFGMGNPAPTLLVPSALLADPRATGEGRHVAFCPWRGRRTVALRGLRPRRLAPRGTGQRRSTRRSAWRSTGTTAPSSRAWSSATPGRPCPRRSTVVGEPRFAAAVVAELDRPLAAGAGPEAELDRRRRPVAAARRSSRPRPRAADRPAGRRAAAPAPPRGAPGDLRPPRQRASRGCSATWWPAAAPCSRSRRTRAAGPGAADAPVGGFAITTWAALEDDPPLRRGTCTSSRSTRRRTTTSRRRWPRRLPGAGWTHLAWGGAGRRLRSPGAHVGARSARPLVEAVFARWSMRRARGGPSPGSCAGRRPRARTGGARRAAAARARRARPRHGRARPASRSASCRAGAYRARALGRVPRLPAPARRRCRCAGHRGPAEPPRPDRGCRDRPALAA